MARYSTTIPSSLPAEQAFAYIADFSSSAEWDPGVKSARRLDDDALGIGSSFEVVVSFFGRTIPLKYRIVEYEAPRLVVLEAHAKLFRSVDTIRVSAAEQGSEVSYEADLRLKGPLRFADPLLQVTFGVVGRRAEAGLKDALAGG